MSDKQQDYVLGFMFSNARCFVGLIQKTKPEWQAGKWNGIGGKVEPLDRTPQDAMAREFCEETGVSIRGKDWVPVAIGSHEGNKVFIFVAQSEKLFDIRQTTAEKPGVFYVNELRYSDVDMLPNLRWLIPLCSVILSTPTEYRPSEVIKIRL